MDANCKSFSFFLEISSFHCFKIQLPFELQTPLSVLHAIKFLWRFVQGTITISFFENFVDFYFGSSNINLWLNGLNHLILLVELGISTTMSCPFCGDYLNGDR